MSGNYNRCQFVFATVVFVFGAAGYVFGQATGDLVVNLVAQKVVIDKNGTEELVPAEQAKPGETLQYTATYHNQGKKPVRGLLATVPLPVGTVLVEGSARPPATAGSTDGKRFAPLPLTRKVKLPTGEQREVAVPLAEYRALQWRVDRLDGNKEVTVTARVRVVTNERPVDRQ